MKKNELFFIKIKWKILSYFNSPLNNKKMMRNLILTTMLMIGVVSLSNAQDYNTGIGLRGGFSNGISIKHFIGDNIALEGIVTTRWQGFSVTGLYEIHDQAFEVERLNWYYGVGGHIGFWSGDKVRWADDNLSYTVIGVDAILGLEYNFKEIPFNLSLDWKPVFNLIGYSGFWGDSGALSIRYIF